MCQLCYKAKVARVKLVFPDGRTLVACKAHFEHNGMLASEPTARAIVKAWLGDSSRI